MPRVELHGGAHSSDSEPRYELLDELARGGVGVVHRGRDHDVGRDVALKVLREEHLKSAEIIRRFIEEAQIGGQLQHPGIVPVYELGVQVDTRPFFAMRLVKGDTLAERFARRSDAADGRPELLGVFRQVCLAMAYAHSRGVIHRDLKPHNIMVGQFGEVQVVDWGFAKILRRGGVHDEQLGRREERDATMIASIRSAQPTTDSLAGSVMGTPAYMPPEQALGRVDELDTRSDIFSLGAILAELLTGRPPYEGSESEQMQAAAAADLEPTHERLASCGAGERLVALCRRCLQPLRKDRPADAAILADEIGLHLADAERRAHESRVRALRAEARVEAQRRAHRLVLRAAAAAAALIVLALGAFWIHGQQVAERERGYRAAIEAALQDAARLRAAGDWDGAVAAATRATELGHAGNLAGEIRAQAEAALVENRRHQEDAAFLAELEAIRARAGLVQAQADSGLAGTNNDGSATDAAFEAAFARRFGSLEAAVPRLAASAHATEFAANLGFWCFTRRLWQKAEGWEPIDQACRRIDPGHEAIRDALLHEDPQQLLDVVRAGVGELPLALAANVGSVLNHHERYADSVAFLQQQNLRNPADYWINDRLGRAAAGLGDYGLAARHLLAAVTARPLDANAWASYAQVLYSSSDPLRHDRRGALRATRRAAELGFDDAGIMQSVGAGLGNMQEFPEALKALRRAVELDPEMVMAHEALGIMFTNLGRYDEAVPVLQRAVSLDPEQGLSLAVLGETLACLGRYEEAVEMSGRAIETEPDRALFHASMARVLARKGDREHAKAAIRRAEALKPTHESATKLVLAWNQLGRTKDALAAADRGLERYPRANYLHGLRGELLQQLRRYDEAIAAYRRTLEVTPSSRHAHAGIGICLLELGRYDEARAEFDAELVNTPDSSEAYRLKALTYARQQRWREASQNARRALELDEGNMEALNLLGESLGGSGDHQGAVKAYTRLVAEAPDTPSARLNLATSLMKVSRFPEAIKVYRELLETEPQNGQVHMYLAAGLWASGSRNEAVAAWRRALPLVEDARLLILLGSSLVQVRQPALAREALRKAWKTNPDDADQLVSIGSWLNDAGDRSTAVAVLQRALERNPKVRSGHLCLGISLTGMGRYDEAARALEQAVALFPDDWQTLALAGKELFFGGRFARARECLERAERQQAHAMTTQYLRLCKAATETRPDKPADLNTADSLTVAKALYVGKRFAESATMYTQAFQQRPKTAEDLANQHRYDAACSAALAGTEAWRGRALAWLRADLEAYRGWPAEQAATVRARLTHWHSDPDLASVRDGAKLSPEAKRLWAEVDAMLARVR